LQSEIIQYKSEIQKCKEELEERNKRLEYAEQINFNEYTTDGLNFDLSERIKLLEEQNEELRLNKEHEKQKEIKIFETKLKELENEK